MWELEGPHTAAQRPEGADATLLSSLVLLGWTTRHVQGPALPRGPEHPRRACGHRTGQLPVGEKGPFGPDVTPSTGRVSGLGPGQEGQPLSPRGRHWASGRPSSRQPQGRLPPGTPRADPHPELPGLACDGAGPAGQEWAQPGTEQAPRGGPGVAQAPWTHTRAFRGLRGAQAWRAPASRRAASQKPPPRTLRRLPLGNTENRMLVLWPRLLGAPGPVGPSPWVMRRHGTRLLGSSVKGTRPQTRHDQRPQAGVLSVRPSVTRAACRTRPAATAVPGAPARSGFPDPEAVEMPRSGARVPPRKELTRGAAGPARGARGATVGNGRQFLRESHGDVGGPARRPLRARDLRSAAQRPHGPVTWTRRVRPHGGVSPAIKGQRC